MRGVATSYRALVVSLFIAMPLTASALGETLNVPAQYPTIQAAIVAAQTGDTVVVAPGTYVETISFQGKGITVVSSMGAAATTIDGNKQGTVVRLGANQMPDSVIQGFTITGGTGSPRGISGTETDGGGIRTGGPNVIVRDCTITHNAAQNGGGIFVEGSQANKYALFENCTIVDNSAQSVGGGLRIDWSGHAEFRGCLFANNTAGGGAGFGVGKDGRLRMLDCTIADNIAVGGGGGGYFFNDYAGQDKCVLDGCTFSGNSSGYLGGGLMIFLGDEDLQTSTASVRRCRFVDNYASQAGGGVWAIPSTSAPIVPDDSISFRDCIFAANKTAGSGGGLHTSGLVTIAGCTFAANSASLGGGLYTDGLGVSPANCIFWNNSDDQIAGNPPDLRYCDVVGGASGTGNIDIDPFFADAAGGDFHLAPTSACVDAGDPATVLNPADETDIDGDTRILFDRIDIGADEATVAKGPWTHLGHALAGAGGPPSLVGSGPLAGNTLATLKLTSAAPSSPTWLVIGAGQQLLPFKGGVVVPTFDMIVGPRLTSPSGSLQLSDRWPANLPPGFIISMQTWIADSSGAQGISASNALAAQSQ